MITKTNINENLKVINDAYDDSLESLHIYGFITFKDSKGNILINKGRNRVTGTGISYLRDMFFRLAIPQTAGTAYNNMPVAVAQANSYFCAGTNAAPTLIDTSTITNEVKTHTPTGSQILYDTALDKYKFIIVGAWNAGSLPSLINEFGMFFLMHNTVGTLLVPDLNTVVNGTYYTLTNSTSNMSPKMFARASVGDGSFNGVSTNLTESYSLEWEVLV